MQVIGFFISLIYRSLFLTGERNFRNTNPILKLAVLILFFVYYLTQPIASLAIILIITAFALIGYNIYWVFSAFTLSSIPGIWYALTALMFSYLKLSGIVTPLDSFWIFLRATALSYIILFYGSMISPTRLANILYKLGKGKESSIPLLIWRITPYGLNSMTESLAIGDLKGEKVSKRLGPAVASLLEYGNMTREACYYRLNNTVKITIPTSSSKKHTLMLLLMLLILIIGIIITL